MARNIKRDPRSSFGSRWTYAVSFSGVKEWLEEHDPREDPVSLITNMVRPGRMRAAHVLTQDSASRKARGQQGS